MERLLIHTVFFFVFTLSGGEGCLTCVSLTQKRSDVGARCVCFCVMCCLSTYNGHQHVGRHMRSQIAEWVS